MPRALPRTQPSKALPRQNESEAKAASWEIPPPVDFFCRVTTLFAPGCIFPVLDERPREEMEEAVMFSHRHFLRTCCNAIAVSLAFPLDLPLSPSPSPESRQLE